VGALEAHIAYVERAFEVERESKDRQIKDQHRQIKALQEQVQELKAQVALLTHRLAAKAEEPGEMT
jgi:cell division protein FtsB